MPLYDIIFTALSIIWVLEFLLFKSRRNTDRSERGSFPWIMTAAVSAVILSIVSREAGLLTFGGAGVLTAGLILYASGIALRYWGILALGRQFTRGVQVREGDQLVSHGPFRLLRHPLYTGLLLLLAGFALFMTSLPGLAIVLFVFLPLLLKRIRDEEAALTRSFGSTYQEWLEGRYRILPFIY
ncbi:isoprenylcysteine carboxylmethyltransferase family protein [Bacillus daqingensis]|uniref:Isoprenylcysteine carboxylmethyltransferase family protein n=1 Tax=Bacillus daqingensis TaxID=872396 RepID=A0ABV9NUF9_9BACI